MVTKSSVTDDVLILMINVVVVAGNWCVFATDPLTANYAYNLGWALVVTALAIVSSSLCVRDIYRATRSGRGPDFP